MIEVKISEKYRHCNVCDSQTNTKTINFRTETERTNFGTQIVLCQKCVHELIKLLLSTDEEEE